MDVKTLAWTPRELPDKYIPSGAKGKMSKLEQKCKVGSPVGGRAKNLVWCCHGNALFSPIICLTHPQCMRTCRAKRTQTKPFYDRWDSHTKVWPERQAPWVCHSTTVAPETTRPPQSDPGLCFWPFSPSPSILFSFVLLITCIILVKLHKC